MKLNESALKIENILFESSYQQQPVAGYLFTNPVVTPCAILQISHGMAEYLMRYRAFAEYLTQHGFVVCGHDHLGHGATSGTDYQDGFFAPENGQYYVLKDILQMNAIVRARYPQLPLVLFGHSMGSFFARWFVELYPDEADAAIICGTGGSNPVGAVGIGITAVLAKLKGATAVSSFVDNLAFGAYTKKIPDCKTKSDWLSVNEENVATYIADPKCGFSFTVRAWNDFMKVLQHVSSKKHFAAIRKDIPLYIIAGDQDPVGNYGAGPAEVTTRLLAAGVQDVTLKLYEGMRHEILNEADATTVCQDILAWCQRVL